LDAEKKSTQFNFISTMLSLFFVPFLGYFADKYVIHSHMGIAAPFFIGLALFLYIFTYPLVPTLIYSIGYSLNYVSVWCNISLCVSEENMVKFLPYKFKQFLLEHSNGDYLFITKYCFIVYTIFNNVYKRSNGFLQRGM
jgi:hypothetical protein